MKSKGFDDLCRSDDEWSWLDRYIARNPISLEREYFSPGQFAETSTKNLVIRRLERIPKSEEGVLWLTRMKGALRQHRYRSPANGRESSTYVLNSSTKKKLVRLAERYKKTETAMVESLINDAVREDADLRQQLVKKKEEDKVARHQTNDALARCREELRETKNQLMGCIGFLAAYEIARGENPLPSDEELKLSEELALQKKARVRKEIEYAVLRSLELSPMLQELRLKRLKKPETL
ncbi:MULTISPECIES: hypothetical protein [Pseudomonadaceae]|uniref:hypothetical protein n=1 Tax=Pseudomonadaceae TaxID=135621 RepID=UPI00103BB555|nr:MULTISPECIES: hypothetical protein [Pseudomonadaceae]MCQ4256387.1 hypothetical protein [Stutzerimonas stutzeri]TCD18149.1 hypothetical protein E0D86_21200 [Pseudomonas sp. IC_126]